MPTGKGLSSMDITDEARDLIKQMLKEQNAEGIRVFFAGFS